MAASAVSESLLAAGASLATLPRRYSPKAGGFREMVVSRYHYILRYDIVPDPDHPNRQAVLIPSVWHPAQDR